MGAVAAVQTSTPISARFQGPERCLPQGFGTGTDWAWEFLEDWRRYSRRAKEILQLALASWEDPKQKKLNRLWLYAPATKVNHWLDEAGATLCVEFDPDGRPHLKLGVSERAGVLGLKGLHLISAVMRSAPIIACSSCPVIFIPERVPSTGERRYCDACRHTGAPQRNASLRYWRKKKSTR
jgi:hypothetical protein